MNNMKSRMELPILAIMLGLTALFASCSNKSTNPQGTFDVYGRVVFRPTVAQPQSEAIFYLFHNGAGIRSALITVRNDTIPVVDSIAGYYQRNMTISIGDTFSYKITSEFGSAEGQVTIPDTVNIIRPVSFPFADTIVLGNPFFAEWNLGERVNGYFAYLEDQGGLVNAVNESQLDTTADMPGENINQIGADRFWLESLSGAFSAGATPANREMPKGVVGAAATFRQVYVTPAR